MKFTPKSYIVPITCGLLIVAAGRNNGINRIAPAAQPTVAVQDTSALSTTFKTNGNVPIVPAVERIPLADVQASAADNFLPVAWYKSKHWWKKNAPIIGGAAGGGLIGGLAGGGAGAVIGGAAGAGGGYLYKRHKEHHQRNEMRYRTTNPTPNQYEYSSPAPVKR